MSRVKEDGLCGADECSGKHSLCVNERCGADGGAHRYAECDGCDAKLCSDCCSQNCTFETLCERCSALDVREHDVCMCAWRADEREAELCAAVSTWKNEICADCVTDARAASSADDGVPISSNPLSACARCALPYRVRQLEPVTGLCMLCARHVSFTLGSAPDEPYTGPSLLGSAGAAARYESKA